MPTAAFINAISEEGTKAEAIGWLQKTWDELCDARAKNERMRHALEVIAGRAQCMDNLLSHAEIAQEVLGNIERLTEPLPSLNWKDGKPYSYCPECGRIEEHSSK